MTQKFTSVRTSLFFLMFLVNGCMGEYEDEEQEEDLGETGREIGVTQEIGNTYDIGVIPSSTSCPNGGPPARDTHG